MHRHVLGTLLSGQPDQLVDELSSDSCIAKGGRDKHGLYIRRPSFVQVGSGHPRRECDESESDYLVVSINTDNAQVAGLVGIAPSLEILGEAAAGSPCLMAVPNRPIPAELGHLAQLHRFGALEPDDGRRSDRHKGTISVGRRPPPRRSGQPTLPSGTTKARSLPPLATSKV